MKKILLSAVIFLLSLSSSFAAPSDMANLNVRIKGALKGNAYFLCFYGSGCYSMRAGSKGRSFPINPAVLANQKKVFVTDIRTRKVYSQPISEACAVKLQSAQTVTISGNLALKNNAPKIENLNCTITS